MDIPLPDGPALLDNQVKNYAWGSRVALAELLGRPAPAAQPEAELWLGAHPGGSSRVSIGGSSHALLDLIEREPERLLGAPVNARFGARLPFLLKVLAAEQPLSIQAHPSTSQARAGFDAEQRAGLAVTGPARNYKDPFHKPELICAVAPFEALCGFRPLPRLIALARAARLTPLERLAEQAAAHTEPLRRLFIGSMRAPPEQRAKLVQTTADACARALARADVTDAADRASLRWLVELAGRYPSDAGVLAPLLLNYVALEPGEALYLGAGSPHAYLHGVGIEIMASSDNVLRGGLTEKHVDIDELERVVRFESSTVTKLQPRVTAAGEAVYRTPAPEFRLSRLELDDHSFSTAVLGPEILLCWQGKLRVQSGSVELDLERGTSAFVPAHSARYSVEGSGTLFRASVGSVSDDQARA